MEVAHGQPKHLEVDIDEELIFLVAARIHKARETHQHDYQAARDIILSLRSELGASIEAKNGGDQATELERQARLTPRGIDGEKGSLPLAIATGAVVGITFGVVLSIGINLDRVADALDRAYPKEVELDDR